MFGINAAKIEKIQDILRKLGDTVPHFDEAGLTSEERVFTQLWSSDVLRTGFFTRGAPVISEGQPITEAHVIIQGRATARQGAREFLLGPGSVIGLSEGVAGQSASWTVHADTHLSTRVIPISQAIEEIRIASVDLRTICQMTVMRILGVGIPPSTLS